LAYYIIIRAFIDIPGIIIVGVWDWRGEAERGNVVIMKIKRVRERAATVSSDVGVERTGIVSKRTDLSSVQLPWKWKEL
jgi:hypothetical protein